LKRIWKRRKRTEIKKNRDEYIKKFGSFSKKGYERYLEMLSDENNKSFNFGLEKTIHNSSIEYSHQNGNSNFESTRKSKFGNSARLDPHSKGKTIRKEINLIDLKQDLTQKVSGEEDQEEIRQEILLSENNEENPIESLSPTDNTDFRNILS